MPSHYWVTFNIWGIYGGKYGILLLWAFYKMDLLWTWTDKKLPLADSDLFKENLE
jgi:hypothetical protein